MRRCLALIVVLASLAAGTASGAESGPLAVFVLAGGGWGHCVGMSQWGAYGQAKAGRDYQQILAHYYRGTEMGAAPATVLERVRVLVGDNLGSVAVTNVRAVFDGSGKRYAIAGGAVTIGPDLKLAVGPAGELVALPAPVTFRALPGSFLTYAGKGFRGDLRVAKSGKGLQLVNLVGLEAYLQGVVPGEMPKDWPLEALKAQAVAARTYAVGNLVKGKGFDLYSDWRSQLYYGVDHEGTGPSQAVKDTRGQILTYGGKPAQTFYFSSSGGRTISALDAFGMDLPYLAAVDDPWDTTSPNHMWTPQLLTGAQLAKRFALRDAIADVVAVPGSPGKPAVTRLTTVAGGTVDVRWSDVRARLGLKSTGFHLGVLRLDRPGVTGVAGVFKLTGVARDVADPVVEQRTATGGWATVKRVTPAADGSFAVKLKLTVTTVLRLASGGLGGPPVTARVAT